MSSFNDFKIDSQLKVALDIPYNMLEKSGIKTGYNLEDETWEVIVKYNGNLEQIKKDLNIEIEILSSNYAVITLKKEQIMMLTLYRQIEYIEQPKNLFINLDTSVSNTCSTLVKQEPYNLNGEGVIVAIIDSGVNYNHKDFKNEDGTTRILYIWDQTINGNPPEGFLGGTLYTKEQIDEALKSENPFSIVPSTDEIGHGTAVCGIACGNGNQNKNYTGIASKSDIIVVKLGEK